MAAKKKTTAVVKSAAPALAVSQTTMEKASKEYLAAAAALLSLEDLPKPVLVETFDSLKGYEDAVSEVAGIARNKMLDLLKSEGSAEGNSLKLTIGDYELAARPRKTGLDAKKLEALLRAKGIDPSTYMSTKVTYEVDAARALLLVSEKRLSQAELDTCIPPIEYNVMRPKRS